MQSKLYYHSWSISKVINFPQAENQSDWSKCTYVCMIGKGKLHLDGLNQSNVSQRPLLLMLGFLQEKIQYHWKWLNMTFNTKETLIKGCFWCKNICLLNILHLLRIRKLCAFDGGHFAGNSTISLKMTCMASNTKITLIKDCLIFDAKTFVYPTFFIFWESYVKSIGNGKKIASVFYDIHFVLAFKYSFKTGSIILPRKYSYIG